MRHTMIFRYHLRFHCLLTFSSIFTTFSVLFLRIITSPRDFALELTWWVPSHDTKSYSGMDFWKRMSKRCMSLNRHGKKLSHHFFSRKVSPLFPTKTSSPCLELGLQVRLYILLSAFELSSRLGLRMEKITGIHLISFKDGCHYRC